MHRACCSKPVHSLAVRNRLKRPVSKFQIAVTCSARKNSDNEGGELLTVEEVQTIAERRAKLKDENAQGWGALGLGVLLGVATFAFGNENGCRTAEILAINDDEYTAQRLVRYYRFFGFKFVKEVSGTDLFDLLVWGGVGTKMNADVQDMLGRWGRALKKDGYK